MSAELAGRSIVNAADALNALDNLDSFFTNIVHETLAFEVPFAHTLPQQLQTRRIPKRLPCFRELREHSQPHFPKFLPALPDDHNTRRSAQETNNQVTFDEFRNKHFHKRSCNSGHFEKDSLVLMKKHCLTSPFSGILEREGEQISKEPRCERVGTAEVVSGTEARYCEIHKEAYSNVAKHTLAPFREHFTLAHPDTDTVEKLLTGHTSVFESTCS